MNLADTFKLEYTPYIWPFVVSLVGTIGLGLYALRYRYLPTTSLFIAMMAALSVWTFCYLMELSSATLVGKIFWASAKYPGSATSPALWFVFSLQLTKHERWLSSAMRAALALYVVGVCLIVFTNSLHHWYWLDIRMLPGFPETDADHGWAFWVYAIVAYAFVLTSMLLYFQYYRATPAYYRWQAGLLALGGFVPLGGRILEDFFGIDIFPRVDNVIILLLVSAIFFALAIFRYGALNIIHIAHDRVIHNIQAGIIVLDPWQRVVELNPYAQELVGATHARSIGQPLADLLIGWPLIAVERSDVQEIETQRRAELACFSLQSSPIHAANGTLAGYVLLFFDITARKRAEQQLESLARTDPLTGAINRRYFFELAASEWARAQRYERPVSVIMLDIDRFKQVNDRYGHQAGDFVLQRVAAECQRHLRVNDLFARYGGEEFICLLSEGGPDSALLLADRLRQSVECLQIMIDGQTITPTLSLGVAHESGAEGTTLEQLIKRADQALYRSKAGGRNRVSVFGD